jgi:hypothetical protein
MTIEGLKIEGIFRVPGRPVEIKAIMASYQKGTLIEDLANLFLQTKMSTYRK